MTGRTVINGKHASILRVYPIATARRMQTVSSYVNASAPASHAYQPATNVAGDIPRQHTSDPIGNSIPRLPSVPCKHRHLQAFWVAVQMRQRICSPRVCESGNSLKSVGTSALRGMRATVARDFADGIYPCHRFLAGLVVRPVLTP
jgi:hypothetical protein